MVLFMHAFNKRLATLPHIIPPKRLASKLATTRFTSHQPRKMALHRLYTDQGFGPLFRLLDDFDSYSRQQSPHHRHLRSIPSFQPKFDVRELKDRYELHGELAGMKKENVEIEFSDPHTMLIRGRIERSYASGSPAEKAEDSSGGAITEEDEQHKKETTATVEDEKSEVSPAESTGEVSKHEKQPEDTAKYWVSERSIGEFSRTFSFPGHIDQQGVKASFKDGVLSVVVPKAKKPDAHRVSIN